MVSVVPFWIARISVVPRGFREALFKVIRMPTDIIVLAVGLLVCLVGSVLVFEIKQGQGPSAITGVGKRRLLALWILSGLVFGFVLIWALLKLRFTSQAEFVPIFAGLVSSLVGFILVKRVADTAANDDSAQVSKSMRWGLLGLWLILIGCVIYLLNWPDNKKGVLGSPLSILASVALAWFVYVLLMRKPDALANDGDPMPIVKRRMLAFYLLFFGIILMALLWRIGSIEFPSAGLNIETIAPPLSEPDASTCGRLSAPSASSQTASSSAISSATGTPSSGAAGGDRSTGIPANGGTGPVLCELFPQTTFAAVPVVYITAYGQKFSADSKLRFNQKTQPTIFIESDRIQAQLDEGTIDSLDPVSVDVITKDQVSRSLAMKIKKARAEDTLLGLQFSLTRELQLLMLALLAGALGSFVHALKSFGDFVGNRTLTASWFWWYITRPFLGAALAAIFYAALRGGFMAGTQADAKSVNQFGVITIGALVGMFADKASDKLADIFDMLFKGTDTRGGKLAAPIIDRLNPPSVPHGSPTTDLKIIGDRLGSVTTVKFDNVVHPHGAVTQTEITVPLTAAELAAPKTIKISVVGDNGESPTKDLQIT